MNPFEYKSFVEPFKIHGLLLIVPYLLVCLCIRSAYQVMRVGAGDVSAPIVDDQLIESTWLGVGVLAVSYAVGVGGGMARAWNSDKKRRKEWILIALSSISAWVAGLLLVLIHILFVRQWFRWAEMKETSFWTAIQFALHDERFVFVWLPMLGVVAVGAGIFWRVSKNQTLPALKAGQVSQGVGQELMSKKFRLLFMTIWFSPVVIAYIVGVFIIYSWH